MRLSYIASVFLLALFLSATSSVFTQPVFAQQEQPQLISLFTDKIVPQNLVIPTMTKVSFRNETGTSTSAMITLDISYLAKTSGGYLAQKIKTIQMPAGSRTEYTYTFDRAGEYRLESSLQDKKTLRTQFRSQANITVLEKKSYDDYVKNPIFITDAKPLGADNVFLKGQDDYILGSFRLANTSPSTVVTISGLTTKDTFGYGKYFKSVQFYQDNQKSPLWLGGYDNVAPWKNPGNLGFPLKLSLKAGEQATVVMVGTAIDSAKNKTGKITITDLNVKATDTLPRQLVGVPVSFDFVLSKPSSLSLSLDNVSLKGNDTFQAGATAVALGRFNVTSSEDIELREIGLQINRNPAYASSTLAGSFRITIREEDIRGGGPTTIFTRGGKNLPYEKFDRAALIVFPTLKANKTYRLTLEGDIDRNVTAKTTYSTKFDLTSVFRRKSNDIIDPGVQEKTSDIFTVVEIKPLITISPNTSIPSPLKVKRGSTKQRIGSFVVSANESMGNNNAGLLTAVISPESSGVVDGKYRSYFKNFYLSDGKTIISPIIQGADSRGVTLVGKLALSANQSRIIDMYADVLTNAPSVRATIILSQASTQATDGTLLATYGNTVTLQKYEIGSSLDR